jgi:phage terminase Nu1 subunit (DNA packaging protein)
MAAKEPADWLPTTCSADDLARCIGVQKRTVQKLAEAGIIKRAPRQRGKYKTVESLHAYTQHLRDKAGGRSESELLTTERAKKAAIDREIAERKLDELNGMILPVDDVVQAWTTLCRSFRQKMLSMPSKMKARIPHLTLHDKKTIGLMMDDMLTELAEEVEHGVIGADPEALNAPLPKRQTKTRKSAAKGANATRKAKSG